MGHAPLSACRWLHYKAFEPQHRCAPLTVEFVPITLRAANAFVQRYHRHNKPVAGHKFSIGVAHKGGLIGVAIAGRPVARCLDDGHILEVTRVCVKPGRKNACSKLYARAARIGQLLGYKSIKTYTLSTETGSSLRAIQAEPEATVKPHKGWNSPSRPRAPQAVYREAKTRWELAPRK